MSGIVGIFDREGARADRELVRALTDFLAYRGPDGCETWVSGEVALGHAALRTSAKSREHRQPATVNGVFTIVADARLDAREELQGKLSMKGEGDSRSISDAELIAHSYARWGEGCVEHLAGDFSLAIWDARESKLFCARDHFGIKPFYYADIEDQFVFSNTLDCVRLHPEFSGELDDQAIGDFLLFGLNLNPATTVFRQIRRLAPAHCLSVTRGGIRTQCYWKPPIDGRIRYQRPEEYVEHYQSLLGESVRERLDGERVGILLSGGLDSGSIAATARELVAKGQRSCEVRAYTVVTGEVNGDTESALAQETARFLGIAHETIQLPRIQPFDSGGDDSISWPEPVNDPFFAAIFCQFRRIAASSRVVLDGEGSDNLMHFEMWPYVKDMVRRREWSGLVSTVPAYLRVRGTIWPGIRRRIREAGGNHPDAPRYPEWLNPEFGERGALRERYREWSEGGVKSGHPVLPSAHATLTLPHWTQLFENENAGVTRAAVDVRYPFLDLRIVKFVLSLPPFPWLYKKALLRRAMAGKLPESVRTRPKTALREDPFIANLAQPVWERAQTVQWSGKIDRYVQRDTLMAQLKQGDTLFLPAAIRPVCLNFWLQSCLGVRYKLSAEAHNG